MKRILSSLSLSVFLAWSPLVYVPAGLVVAGCVTGCKTANQAAYKATGTVIVSVEAAMSAWRDYVATGKATLEQRTAVKNAFEKYQAAMLVVTSAGAAHAKILADKTADPTTALSTLNAAIAISAATLEDLINLVRTFGVKL